MKFSLWMIRELLKDYQTEIRINEEEKRTIEIIRLFYGGSITDKRILYIESSNTLFHDGDNAVACVHGENILWIKTPVVNAVFNKILDFFEECQTWEQELNRRIRLNCLLKDVLNEFKDVLPLPLMVLDNGQMLLATSDNYGMGMIDEEWDFGLQTGRFQVRTISAFNALYSDKVDEQGSYEVPADPFPYPSYNRNIFIENEFVGYICMILVRDMKEVYKDWFEIACGVIMDWIELYMQQNEILLRQEIFSELLEGDTSHLPQFANAMDNYGWRREDQKRLLVLGCISNILNMNQHISKLLNRESAAVYAIEYQNYIVAIVNDSLMKKREFEEKVTPVLRKSGYYGGISDSFTDLDNLFQNMLQAKIALQHGEAYAGSFHHIKDHMVPYIFQIITDQNEVDMRHPALEVLKQHDRKHESDYYRILKVYLECGCSQTQAAEKLYLHRNTLIRKIEKIQNLFHIDFNNYEVRLHLMMSYEMDRVGESDKTEE